QLRFRGFRGFQGCLRDLSTGPAFGPGAAVGEDVGREDWRAPDSSSVTSTDSAKLSRWKALKLPTRPPCRDPQHV
ncbi:hypothetical protein GBF38_018437, partial [Nibea albiflora]